MKKYLLFFLLLAVVGVGFGFYQYHKPHQSMEKMTTDFQLQAADLFAEFSDDEKAAEEKYLDKIIQVSGKVTKVSQKEDGSQTIALESEDMIFGVLCELDPLTQTTTTDFKNGDQISLKGICSGMLSDVVLVRCVVL